MNIKSICLGMLSVSGCVTHEPGPPSLSMTEIERRVPRHANDRDGWARDISAAIVSAGADLTVENVCAVVAVTDQESNLQIDPVVPELPKIVREAMIKKLHKLGPLAEPALAGLLLGHAPGTDETFGTRIAKLRTEQDLDRFFRDMAAAYREKFPGSFLVANALYRVFGNKGFEDLNPITTAGSMQVKVGFARTLDEFKSLSDSQTRDLLYTRAGGLRAGTSRLLGYKAAYNQMMYRFADYNAGVYASRNAAFQKLLSDLTKQPLALDGDLLAYDDQGNPLDTDSKSLKALLLFTTSRDMWEWRARQSLRKEKESDFETTAVWEDVRAAWKDAHGTEPDYARIPNVTLQSPKLSGKRTTGWFAESVSRRYKACL